MLEYIEGKQTPSLVCALVIGQKIHGHVSGRMFDEAVEKHPEYFPEEVEYRRKVALVPESVWEAYREESARVRQKFDPSDRPMRGLMHYIRHPEDQPEMDAWNKEYWRLEPERTRAENECYNKHFAIYGLTK